MGIGEMGHDFINPNNAKDDNLTTYARGNVGINADTLYLGLNGNCPNGGWYERNYPKWVNGRNENLKRVIEKIEIRYYGYKCIGNEIMTLTMCKHSGGSYTYSSQTHNINLPLATPGWSDWVDVSSDDTVGCPITTSKLFGTWEIMTRLKLTGTAASTCWIACCEIRITSHNEGRYWHPYGEQEQLVDGNTGTFAFVTTAGVKAKVISNNLTDEDLGFLDPDSNILVRINGSYGSAAHKWMVFQPEFKDGTLGDLHYIELTGAWSTYVNITNDTNAPTWTKEEIKGLKGWIWAVDTASCWGRWNAVGKMEIRITQRRYISNIAHVTVVGEFNEEDGATYGDCKARFAVRTHGITYYSDELNLETTKKKYNYRWITNPNTGNPWTEQELVDAKFGVSLISNGDYAARCHRFYMIVQSNNPVIPQIKTMGLYAEVHLQPKEIECEINKPETTSFDHSRNVNILNFWSGERAVYDLSRSGKNIVLTGKEFDWDCTRDCDSECYQYPRKCACDRLKCIDAMGRDGSEIAISGYSFEPWNKNYRILSFGYKLVQSKPAMYEYVLELEEA
jgi:hypothetical protein